MAKVIQMDSPTLDRMIRFKELTKLTGVSRQTIMAWVAAGTFPAPIALGVKARAWRASAIEKWMANLPRR